MQITIEFVALSNYELGFYSGWLVAKGDKFAQALSWDEMLGLVASLTMPEGRRPCEHWLQTAAEHRAEHERIMASTKKHAAEFITEAREHPGEE